VYATASHIKAEVDSLADRFVNTDPVLLEVDRRPDELDKLIQSHDIVIRSAASVVDENIGDLPPDICPQI